jgi:hypothetical protein
MSPVLLQPGSGGDQRPQRQGYEAGTASADGPSVDQLVAVLWDERRELQFEFRAAESLRQLGEGLDRSID